MKNNESKRVKVVHNEGLGFTEYSHYYDSVVEAIREEGSNLYGHNAMYVNGKQVL